MYSMTRTRPARPEIRPACSEALPRVGETVCDGQPVELHRQGAVGEVGGQGLGLVLGEAAGDLHLAVERGERRLGGLGDRGGDDLAVEVDADDGVELLLGQGVPLGAPRHWSG